MRQSIRSINPDSCSGCDTHFEARHSLEAAVVDELDVESANHSCFPKHVGLQLTSGVPRGLAASRGIEGKD